MTTDLPPERRIKIKMARLWHEKRRLAVMLALLTKGAVR